MLLMSSWLRRLGIAKHGQSFICRTALGRDIADAIIALRENDGYRDFVDYVAGNSVGQWQPTAPMFDVAMLPQWADVRPFAMTSPDQFRPAGPPALTSTEYATAFDEVRRFGEGVGSDRTTDQTNIARFWADGPGTYTPPGHWNLIAANVAEQQGNSLAANSRLFAQLNVALADAAIVAWDAKYTYEFWRPITAIQNADLDGNAATTADETWQPFLITPPFPEYVSGHSTFSGAASQVLTSIFGNNVSFTSDSPGFLVNGQPVQRTFSNFQAAANEAGQSRIYGGIHFQFANQDGLAAGRELADYVLHRFAVTTDDLAPTVSISSPDPDLEIEVGQANTVMGTMGTREDREANLDRPEVYLPRLKTSILQAVSDTQVTTIGADATAAPNLTDEQRQFLKLEIQPGSLIGHDGQPVQYGQVGISTVPSELVRDMLAAGRLALGAAEITAIVQVGVLSLLNGVVQAGENRLSNVILVGNSPRHPSQFRPSDLQQPVDVPMPQSCERF